MSFKSGETYNTKLTNLSELTFEDVASTGRGYDENDPQKKTDYVFAHKYPICLYVAYRNIMKHNHNPAIRSISDVQRYSTILGQAVLSGNKQYQDLKQLCIDASDSDDLFVQYEIDNLHSYNYITPTVVDKRKIATVVYVKRWIEEESHTFQMHQSELTAILSLFGLDKALNGIRDKTRVNIEQEIEQFVKYIQHQTKKVNSYSGEMKKEG